MKVTDHPNGRTAGTSEALRSGTVAAAAGVNQQTLRYHERRGCLPSPIAPSEATGSTQLRP